MKVICINNDNWFGTLKKEYEVLDVKCKTVKELRESNYEFRYIGYIVIDDRGKEVEISSSKFAMNLYQVNVLDRIRKEKERLNKCQKHVFVTVDCENYKCLKCNCFVDKNFVLAYKQGYEHGLNRMK